jgi:hypothetical protein
MRLLKRQLDELQTVRGLNYENPIFKAWHDTTRIVLETFLGPDSHYTTRFRNTRFFSMVVEPFDGDEEFSEAVSANNGTAFRVGCEDFGVYVEEAKPTPVGRGDGRRGGVTQNFNGPVTFQAQAIATDNAIQKIEHMGDTTGASLKEIAALLQQSEDLMPRQVKEGLAAIEGLAEEVQKPEPRRNWKAVFGYGEKVLEIAGKAIDLGEKLAPYTPAIAEIVANARHLL